MIEFVFVALLQAVAGQPDTSGPAPASQEQTSAPSTAAPGGGEPERLRCRREPIIGTRLSRRICTTEAEDQMITDESRNMINRIQGQRHTLPSN